MLSDKYIAVRYNLPYTYTYLYICILASMLPTENFTFTRIQIWDLSTIVFFYRGPYGACAYGAATRFMRYISQLLNNSFTFQVPHLAPYIPYRKGVCDRIGNSYNKLHRLAASLGTLIFSL